MKCEFCGAEAKEDLEVCPSCGKLLQEETVTEITESVDTVAAGISELPGEGETTKSIEKELPAKESDKTTARVFGARVSMVVAITCAVLLLSILGALLLSAFGVFDKFLKNDDPEEIQATEPAAPAETSPVQEKSVYTADDATVAKESNTVVATIGDKKLTNAQLQIYYRIQLQDFLANYGSYLSMMGLDLTLPLSEQQSYFDPNLTWEQYLLNIALQTWQNTQTLGLLAEESGFVLDEAFQKELEGLHEVFEEQAATNGYESVEAMMQDLLGPGGTAESYIEYITLMTICNQFYAAEYQRLMPSDEDCEAYYVENEELFLENAIHKESGLAADVRHILVCPKGGTTDENGVTTYSDEEWDACLAEAEKILDEWKAGDATEESFAALVPTYTEDPGSSTTGGLYTDINPTSSYVENFLNWTVDMTRQPGDTGIVKTEYGYHIMYFVSGEPHWLATARVALLSERTTAMIDNAESKWPMNVEYSKIVLNELNYG